jgi:hypothetical protein
VVGEDHNEPRDNPLPTNTVGETGLDMLAHTAYVTYRPFMPTGTLVLPSVVPTITCLELSGERTVEHQVACSGAGKRHAYPPKNAVLRRYLFIGIVTLGAGGQKNWTFPSPPAAPSANSSITEGCLSRCRVSPCRVERRPML